VPSKDVIQARLRLERREVFSPPKINPLGKHRQRLRLKQSSRPDALREMPWTSFEALMSKGGSTEISREAGSLHQVWVWPSLTVRAPAGSVRSWVKGDRARKFPKTFC